MSADLSVQVCLVTPGLSPVRVLGDHIPPGLVIGVAVDPLVQWVGHPLVGRVDLSVQMLSGSAVPDAGQYYY